jgi:hypothetical protein
MSRVDAWCEGWAKALIFPFLFRWLKPTAIELGIAFSVNSLIVFLLQERIVLSSPLPKANGNRAGNGRWCKLP